MAEKLHINQSAVSKLERRTDMYLSTLRNYIEAMGGTLEIVAHFPNRAVRITQFEASILKAGRKIQAEVINDDAWTKTAPLQRP